MMYQTSVELSRKNMGAGKAYNAVDKGLSGVFPDTNITI